MVRVTVRSWDEVIPAIMDNKMIEFQAHGMFAQAVLDAMEIHYKSKDGKIRKYKPIIKERKPGKDELLVFNKRTKGVREVGKDE